MIHEYVDLIRAMQKKAARNGANAIVIEAAQETPQMMATYNPQLGIASAGSYAMKTMLCRAIRIHDDWKSRTTPSVGPKNQRRTGTGFFITEDGMFITAAHVVAEGNSFVIKTKSGEHAAEVLVVDAANDLALLKAAGHFDYLPISTGSSPSVAEEVFTIGYPNPDIQGAEPKYTAGEISSTRGLKDDPRYFQITCPVQPGNSGGPLISLKSYSVIGVVTAQLDGLVALQQTGSLPQNVNYAVKISYLMPLLANIANSENAVGFSHEPTAASKDEIVRLATGAVGSLVVE